MRMRGGFQGIVDWYSPRSISEPAEWTYRKRGRSMIDEILCRIVSGEIHPLYTVSKVLKGGRTHSRVNHTDVQSLSCISH